MYPDNLVCKKCIDYNEGEFWNTDRLEPCYFGACKVCGSLDILTNCAAFRLQITKMEKPTVKEHARRPKK